MQQRGDKHFIDLLNKACVGNVKSEVKRTLKSRIMCSSDFHNRKYALHVFAENTHVFNHNKVMLDQINGKLVAGFQIVKLWQLEIAAFLKKVA